MTGTPLVDLDTPLVGPVGKKAADALAAKLGLHTVGDLRPPLPAPLRRPREAHRDRGPGARRAHHGARGGGEGHHARHALPARQADAGRHHATGTGGGWTARSSTAYKLRRSMVARGAGGVLRQGRRVPGQAAAHPPGVRAARGERGRPPVPVGLPGAQGFDSWQIARCVRQVLELLDDRHDPCRRRCAARRACPSWAARCAASTCPRAEATVHRRQHRLVWDEAMGVQLALALRRRRGRQRPAAANPPRSGGLLEAFDARLPFTLTAGQRAVGEEIAADMAPAAPDEPAGAGRRRRGQDGGGAAGDAAGGRRGRQAAMLAPTEVLAAQHARSLRALLGPLAQAGELGGAEQATRVTLLIGLAAARGEEAGAAGGAVRRGRDRRRHARADPGPGGVRRAGAGRGRRAAPLRRRAARRPARARRDRRRTCW